jgi:tetratricopeptide (TPR) repeat protein
MNDELSLCADMIGVDPVGAAERLRLSLKRNPLDAKAYRLLARAIEADRGNARDGIVSTIGSRVEAGRARAAQALAAGDLEQAEIILRPHLRNYPSDAVALRLLAALAVELGYAGEAEALLEWAVELDPGLHEARFDLAALCYRSNRAERALELLAPVSEAHPRNFDVMNLAAAALARAGRETEAAASYERSLQGKPDQHRIWVGYGNLLRTLGRTADCVAALRKAIGFRPAYGEAWLSLADLKTVDFTASDIAAMEDALKDEGLGGEDRFYLHLALGRALESAEQWGPAFEHYATGNRMYRRSIDYDPDKLTAFVRQSIEVLRPALFEQAAGAGFPASDPIFIVGMPRSGSTLVEQILASHPMVEGTMELPEMLNLARTLGTGSSYVDAVARLDRASRRKLGEDYVERTRRYRRSGRPRFVDKMPNNWMHIPLIQLILPQARIVDVRRHPLACGLSNYKQHFLGGHPFSYDLREIGLYYADYVEFMRHIDDVLPGKVHRLIYEDLIAAPEAEIRRLLDHLGLPFDRACLDFHETSRVVRSASAQQVRMPLNRKGLEEWTHFAPYLGELKDALGPVLDTYREPPAVR